MIAQQNLREKKKKINDEDYFEEETAPVNVSQPPSPPSTSSTTTATTTISYLPFFDDDDEVGQAFIKSAQIPYVTVPCRSPTTSPRSPLPTSPGTSPRRPTLGAISAPPSMSSFTEPGTGTETGAGDVSKGWNKPSGFQRVTPKLTEKPSIALSKHRADDGSRLYCSAGLCLFSN
jgi:hypothetical protein